LIAVLASSATTATKNYSDDDDVASHIRSRMTNNEGMHAKSKSKVRRRYPALQLFRIEPSVAVAPRRQRNGGQPAARTDRVGVWIRSRHREDILLYDRVPRSNFHQPLGDAEVDSDRSKRKK